MTLQVRGLGKQQVPELASKARRLGMTPQMYVKRLVEQGLALDRTARTTTLADMVGLGRQFDEEELDRLVEQAQTLHITGPQISDDPSDALFFIPSRLRALAVNQQR